MKGYAKRQGKSGWQQTRFLCLQVLQASPLQASRRHPSPPTAPPTANPSSHPAHRFTLLLCFLVHVLCSCSRPVSRFILNTAWIGASVCIFFFSAPLNRTPPPPPPPHPPEGAQARRTFTSLMSWRQSHSRDRGERRGEEERCTGGPERSRLNGREAAK